MPRATSDSHLSRAPPEAPPIRLPAPLRRSSLTLDMIQDADAYNISVSSPVAPPTPSAAAAAAAVAAASRSPPHSPRRARGSPPPFNAEPSPVSFSEYVASELARDQAAQEPFSVTFAPAAARATDHAPPTPAPPPPPPPPPPQRPPPDPFDSDSDGGGGAGASVVEHAADAIPRSETEPNLPVACAPAKPPHGAQQRAPPFAHMATGAPMVHSSNKARYADGKLDCIQIDAQGTVSHRQMRRADILQEARSAFPGSQPPPHVVNKWLNGDAPLPSPELKQFSRLFEPDAVANRKTAQKALRDYLRNSLQARDIRQVDPAFAAKPALWVRHSAIVVSLEGLRAIILYNKMFLFDPATEKTRSLLYIATQSITAQPDAENPQPFEFRALEGILIYLNMVLEQEFSSIKPQIEKYVHQMPNELTTKMLEELRLKKHQLNQFHARANSVRSVLENLLDEDEEMASMYLTEKHISENYARSAVDHSEVETLLEAYMQAIDQHVNQASLLNDGIEDTEDLMMIHLDTLRNRLLSVELAMSVVSMMFGLGGVVAGVFGMNITIPLFDASASRFWFLAVVLVITITVVCVSWLLLVMLRRRGLYSFY